MRRNTFMLFREKPPCRAGVAPHRGRNARSGGGAGTQPETTAGPGRPGAPQTMAGTHYPPQDRENSHA